MQRDGLLVVGDTVNHLPLSKGKCEMLRHQYKRDAYLHFISPFLTLKAHLQGCLQPIGGIQPGGPSLQKSLHLRFAKPPGTAAQAAVLPPQDLMHCDLAHLAALNFTELGTQGQHALAPDEMVN